MRSDNFGSRRLSLLRGYVWNYYNIYWETWLSQVYGKKIPKDTHMFFLNKIINYNISLTLQQLGAIRALPTYIL